MLKQWRNAPVRRVRLANARTGATLGGAKFSSIDYCFFTKNRPIRQENVPYLGQLSVWSTRKNIWGYRKLQGAPNGL